MEYKGAQISEQKNIIRILFEKEATSYSQVRERTYSFLTQKKIVLELVDGYQGKVLEIGCGGGYLLLDLMKRNFQVFGLDISIKMLTIAKKRAIKAEDKIHLMQGDIENLPFYSNEFEVIICMGVLEYLSSKEKALQEIYRVVKPGGVAILSIPNAISLYYLTYELACFLYRPIRKVLNMMHSASSEVRYRVFRPVPGRLNKLTKQLNFKIENCLYCNFFVLYKGILNCFL